MRDREKEKVLERRTEGEKEHKRARDTNRWRGSKSEGERGRERERVFCIIEQEHSQAVGDDYKDRGSEREILREE